MNAEELGWLGCLFFWWVKGAERHWLRRKKKAQPSNQPQQINEINLSFFFGGRRSEASQRMKKKVNLAEGVGWLSLSARGAGYGLLRQPMLRKERRQTKANNQPKRSQISRNNERMNCWGLWGGAHLRGRHHSKKFNHSFLFVLSSLVELFFIKEETSAAIIHSLVFIN